MFCYRAHVKAIHVRTGARVYHVMKQVTTIVNAAKTTLVSTARTVSFFWNCFSLSPVLKNRMRIGPVVLIRRLQVLILGITLKTAQTEMSEKCRNKNIYRNRERSMVYSYLKVALKITLKTAQTELSEKCRNKNIYRNRERSMVYSYLKVALNHVNKRTAQFTAKCKCVYIFHSHLIPVTTVV